MLLKFSNLATDKSTMVTLLHRATALLLFMKTSVFRIWLYLTNKSTLPASIINLRHIKQKWVELLTPQTTMLHEKIEHSLKPGRKKKKKKKD